MPHLIALGNKSRVGKDTVADYLVEYYGFAKISFAQTIYDILFSIQRRLGKKEEKDALLLQFLGAGLRKHYGSNVFIGAAFAGRPLNMNVVVSDMRYKNEFEYLKSRGFTTVRIVRPNRPIDRDPTHESEVDLDNAKFDHNIINSGTIEDLYVQIDKILKKK